MFSVRQDIIDVINKKYSFPFDKTESLAEWRKLCDSHYLTCYVSREHHTCQRGYPIITTEVLDLLSSFLKQRRVADVGCGTGYLSYHLLEKGVDVTPIDNRSSHYTDNDSPIDAKVIKCDYNELDVSPYDTFIVSWPNYASDEIELFVSRLPEGSTLIYQGEGYGGCTGTDRFHGILDEEYTLLDDITGALNRLHMQFEGIHDRWHVYVKD